MLTLLLSLFACPQAPPIPMPRPQPPPTMVLAGPKVNADGFAESEKDRELLSQLDAYLDVRWSPEEDATAQMANAIREAGYNHLGAWLTLLGARRVSYPDASEWVGAVTWHPVECAHVDYASEYALYVPENYNPQERYSLVVVGHGGNSSMSAEQAHSTAEQYLKAYAPEVTSRMRAIVVAPASERGWGPIGYSLVFSTISAVQRRLPIDPDGIYVTGQSMGGHLAYRMGLLFGDRFAAISPHSGGYDFVEKESIGNLLNVPGFAVFGSTEPYGINADNKANAEWATKYQLDWEFHEMDGGHTIYTEMLGPMAGFFRMYPRNSYRGEVYLRQGGSMLFERTWEIEGWPEHTVFSEERPLRWNRRHWLEVEARPDHGEPIAVYATVGENEFEIISDNLKRARLYLHRRLVNHQKEIRVRANGRTVFRGVVEPDLEGILERARADDDRGRIYTAVIDIEIKGNRTVKLPKRR